MLSNLWSKFLKVTVFALVGNLAVAIGNGVAAHQPIGLDMFGALGWPLVASVVAGAVAAVKRFVQWNPEGQ